MKVFFSMSYRNDVALGRRMFRHIKRLGYFHTSDAIMTSAPEKYSSYNKQQRLVFFKKLFNSFNQAEIVVLECSLKSLTSGQFIQEALHRDIPTLVLVKDLSEFTYIDSLQKVHHKFLIQEYSDDNYEEIIQDGLEYLVGQIDTRFTLLLPPEIVGYLDNVYEKTGKSRAEFIRALIRKSMR